MAFQVRVQAPHMPPLDHSVGCNRRQPYCTDPPRSGAMLATSFFEERSRWRFARFLPL